jgi:uncharacterized RDD family membrane protein YckC
MVTAPSAARVEYAGFWIRGAALLIDAVLIAVLTVLITPIAPSHAEFTAFAIGFVYTVSFWTVSGATPGKMILGLRIIKTDGNEIGKWRSLLRYVALGLCVGYLLAILNSKKRALHDYIAGTIVIKTR